jgi:hypothetical protein
MLWQNTVSTFRRLIYSTKVQPDMEASHVTYKPKSGMRDFSSAWSQCRLQIPLKPIIIGLKGSQCLSSAKNHS